MVLEYLPTFARTKSPSFVGKYTSTVVRIWVIVGATTMYHENLSMNIMAIQLYTTSEALPIGEAVV